jgi:hypothetical protein
LFKITAIFSPGYDYLIACDNSFSSIEWFDEKITPKFLFLDKFGMIFSTIDKNSPNLVAIAAVSRKSHFSAGS